MRFLLKSGKIMGLFYMLRNINIENLKIEDMAKAGVHYGYSKTRCHPSTKGYINSIQNGVNLIDLKHTKSQLSEANSFLKEIVSQDKHILFICEKVELADISREIALSLNYPYISNRFIGGSITNFSNIKKRVEKLQSMLKDKEEGAWNKFTKKEQLLMQREVSKLDKNFGGLVNLINLPGAIVVIDSKYEEIPVAEAAIAHIPVISISNVDCDISSIEYPIVANDSSRSSVELILNVIKNSITEKV